MRHLRFVRQKIAKRLPEWAAPNGGKAQVADNPDYSGSDLVGSVGIWTTTTSG